MLVHTVDCLTGIRSDLGSESQIRSRSTPRGFGGKQTLDPMTSHLHRLLSVPCCFSVNISQI